MSLGEQLMETRHPVNTGRGGPGYARADVSCRGTPRQDHCRPTFRLYFGTCLRALVCGGTRTPHLCSSHVCQPRLAARGVPARRKPEDPGSPSHLITLYQRGSGAQPDTDHHTDYHRLQAYMNHYLSRGAASFEAVRTRAAPSTPKHLASRAGHFLTRRAG